MDESFDLRHFLDSLPQQPGVYRMLDQNGVVIYVGKAKNLKKRVVSYFQNKEAAPKQQALIARTASMDVRITNTEAEALLLECQLIKRHRPRYNVTLRDDKSYPGIYVSTQHPFPRISFYRGNRLREGLHYGPYPSALAVRECLKLLQRVFPVRQCRDSFYENRTRPCLEYQIDRCTAPCVGLVDSETYGQDVKDTLMFLEGDGSALIDSLIQRMEKASEALAFEQAARYRDQIALLRTILEKQSVSGDQGNLDIFAIAHRGGIACIHLAMIRNGLLIGDRNHFPLTGDATDSGEILASFIGQYYLEKEIPREIRVNTTIQESDLLEEVLAQQSHHAVQITSAGRGDRARRIALAEMNAETALEAHLASRASLLARFETLAEVLSLSCVPERLECIDISHTQGQQTVASCVVFDRQGPVKSAYRRFNIESITQGDDYAAIAQTVERHYRRILSGECPAPDILFIDGGKGQVSAARRALRGLGHFPTRLFGVSKGPDRKVGQEVIVCGDSHRSFMLPSHSSALLLIQQIRDEAHRFAVTGHRQRRAKILTQSVLDEIQGLGPKRRQQLLREFGGLREIRKASIDALASVEGISRQLAERIHAQIHTSE